MTRQSDRILKSMTLKRVTRLTLTLFVVMMMVTVFLETLDSSMSHQKKTNEKCISLRIERLIRLRKIFAMIF